MTFGVFNRVDKISADAVRVWSQLLTALPQSKLVIKHGSLNDAALRELLVGRFTAQGIAAERIRCLGATPRLEHLAAYEGIDICLDPFPQNGGVSTWEALQVGVPLLAKLGNSNASRWPALPALIGLNEWVAETLKCNISTSHRNTPGCRSS